MLTYEEALERLLSRVPEPRVITVPMQQSLHKVLACPVVADLDLPPFRKSFVDGFAVRSQDVTRVPVRLQVVGTVAAGARRLPSLGPGQAVEIMTGAAVPPSADAVQMVEQTRRPAAATVEVLQPVSAGANIAPQANEVRRGSTVLRPGRFIGPAEVGVLATFGRTEVEVYAAPSVAVMTTGDEVIGVDQTPEFGQIRNSNGFMLEAQCRELGLEATLFPAVPDDRERTRHALCQGLEYELLLLTGGVSMGEYDYVHQVLAEVGVETFFHKAAIQPGKPLLAGRRDNHMVFGLPGNPVSAFVTFELFVRPTVRRWMGSPVTGLTQAAGCLTAAVRHKPGRKLFHPAWTTWSAEGFRVSPVATKGSADLTAFAGANSLLIMEADTTVLEAGQRVEVLLLDRYDAKGAGHEADPSG